MFKKFLVVLSLALIFVPGLVSATVTPDLNPLCWTSKECADQRKKDASAANIDLTDTEAVAGFVANEGVCSGETEDHLKWGKCLAGGQANTEIGIGGVKTFKNIGEYIKVVYNYLLGIASIVAVVMLIVAGAQWIVAAGSSEVIGQAKKRISGALIGLVLAWSSYLILNTINPWLTNFRLPQTWMIRQAELIPEFCRVIETSGVKLAMVEDKNTTPPTKKDPNKFTAADYGISLLKDPDTGKIKDERKIKCNQIFTPSGASGATCAGHYCEKGLCFQNYDTIDDVSDYYCMDANIAGKVTNSDLNSRGSTLICVVPGVNNGWEPPYITGGRLVAVCEGGFTPMAGYAKFNINDLPNKEQFYTFRLSRELNPETDCPKPNLGGVLEKTNYYKVLGYALSLEINGNCDPTDETHVIGKGGKDLGYTGAAGLLYPYFYSLSEVDLFSPDDIKNGIQLNIDVSNIKNI